MPRSNIVANAFVTKINEAKDTTTTLTASPNPGHAGANVTFTATVTGNAPSGTVSFYDGSNVMGTASLSGTTAQYVTSTLAGGSQGLPETAVWKRQSKESYEGRIVYLKQQNPAKAELLNFDVESASCYRARKRDDATAGITYLRIAQGELRRYGAKQDRIDGLESIIRDLQALPK